MIFEHDFSISIRDVGQSNKLTNKSILSFLEDIGSLHSDQAGYGLNDIYTKGVSWILLNWKVKILKRPIYKDILHIKTWARLTEKIYTYRDYEIYDQTGELVAIATSKWVLMDIYKNRITKISPKVIEKYLPENKSVFPEEEVNFKLEEPFTYEKELIYTVGRKDIDINKHMHNVNYLDLAYEALPEEVYENVDFTNIEILYKKEIKYGQTLKCLYTNYQDTYYITIKNETKDTIHAIIKLS